MEITLNQYIERLQSLHGIQGSFTEHALMPAATRLLNNVHARIQKQGLNSNNAPIGQYSTKPIYATRAQFYNKGAFAAQGKEAGVFTPKKVSITKVPKTAHYLGDSKPIGDKSRKAMYLPLGYRQLKDIQGMESSFVNMTYSGRMMNDYVLSLQPYHIDMGFHTMYASVLRKKNEHRFGESIFAPTQQEISSYENDAVYSINKLTRNTIEGITITPIVEV